MVPEIVAVVALAACLVAWLATLRIYHVLLTSRDQQLERLVDQIVALVEKLPNVMSPWLQAATASGAKSHERESAETRASSYSSLLTSEAQQNLRESIMAKAGVSEKVADAAVREALGEFGSI